ncbi:MAG: polysaccharide deacetylase family sporulation protein PdaB [Candidatus Acidiferrum sp.]
MELLLVGASVAVATAGGIAAYGAAWPRSQLFGTTICSTNAPRKLALTFDDGPNPTITPQLLDLLDRYQARATFFLVGKFVRGCPAIAHEIVARGHAIGNHTETHPNLAWCGAQETWEELRRCNEAIFAATAKTPRWFRPPFGLRSPWLVGVAGECGLSTVRWTRSPGDWRAKPADWLIKRMQPIAARARQNPANSSSTSGDILCLHDGNYARQSGDRTRTLAALKYWLPRWRDLGLKFVTIDEAIDTPGD